MPNGWDEPEMAMPTPAMWKHIKTYLQETAWVRTGSSMIGGGFLGATLGSGISTIVGVLAGLCFALIVNQREKHYHVKKYIEYQKYKEYQKYDKHKQ